MKQTNQINLARKLAMEYVLTTLLEDEKTAEGTRLECIKESIKDVTKALEELKND